MVGCSRKSLQQGIVALLQFMVFVLGVYADCSAWEGKVLSIIDGDSLIVSHDGKKEQVDFYGIDCPEKEQDFGQVARNYTMQRLQGQLVDIEPSGKTRYDPAAALVSLEGNLFNLELVRVGLAWIRTQKCTRPECEEWREIQKQAKRKRSGVWSTFNPIPPWEFKRSKDAQKIIYSGDIVTHVFHSTNCEEFDCWNCIAVFRGREAAIKAGYTPCELCKP
ncbi:MAG: nuclease [Deltaproteobacteria bacterium]|nr:nuclease [Deltaproteobacteria bacterium]